MRRSRSALAAALLAAITASQASAQARGSIGFGGGAAFPVGNFRDIAKTGWIAQVIAAITGPSGKIGGRIDGMYAQNKYKDITGHVKFVGSNVAIVISPMNRPAKVLPYFLGGIGFANVKTVDVPPIAAADVTKFSFNGGAGLQLRAGDRLSLYIEGRFISVRTDGPSNFIPVTVGFRFGGI